MQFRKKLVFSMVLRFSLFGKNIILPNLQGILRCFRSVKLVVYADHAMSMQRNAVVAIRFPASFAIRCLAARAISPGARWCVVCVLLSVSGCTPPPLPPGVAEKRGGSQATTHALRHTAF